MSISDVKLIELPKKIDHRGNLTFFESLNHIPFEIKRIFFTYNVPCDMKRGGHAHKKSEQFLICLSGSLEIELDDGKNKTKLELRDPSHGLYVPPMIWGIEKYIEDNTICLVACNDYFDENDYYQNYDDFIKIKNS